jgi:DNA-binding NtrC family response regulator
MFSRRIAEDVSGARLDVDLLYDAPLSSAVSRLEKSMVEKTLIQTNWNKSQTAKRLGLSRQGLLQKIRRYGICPTSLGGPVEDSAS